jgi:Icc-related predicted phosphoesterase
MTYAEMQTVINRITCVGCEVRVLAGDIGRGWMLGAFLRELLAKTNRRVKTLYIPGNHEHWGRGANKYIEDASSELGIEYENFHPFDKAYALEIEGYRFIGCVGWPLNIHDLDSTNDSDQIEDLIPAHHRRAYEDREHLYKLVDDRSIVITHYLPHSKSIHRDYALCNNRGFLSNYSDLIEERSPVMWLHGHTHKACDYVVGNTRVVCNPHGYPGETTGFSFSKVIRPKRLEPKEEYQPKRFIYSGVCICGHSYEDHHLGIRQDDHPADWPPYVPQECEYYGCNELGGRGPDGEPHCGHYIDKDDPREKCKPKT